MKLILASGQEMVVDGAEHIAFAPCDAQPGDRPDEVNEYERARFAQRGSLVVRPDGVVDRVADVASR
jgi:hypothetical protein